MLSITWFRTTNCCSLHKTNSYYTFYNNPLKSVLYSTPKLFRWSLSLRFSDCTLHAFLTSHVPAATTANLLCLDHCGNTQWTTQVMRRFCAIFRSRLSVLPLTLPIFPSALFSQTQVMFFFFSQREKIINSTKETECYWVTVVLFEVVDRLQYLCKRKW
jgi:hypothetical protein